MFSLKAIAKTGIVAGGTLNGKENSDPNLVEWFLIGGALPYLVYTFLLKAIRATTRSFPTPRSVTAAENKADDCLFRYART